VSNVFLSPYQTAGFDTATMPAATLHAALVRRVDDPKVIRFSGRATTSTDIRRLPVCQTTPSRTLAKIRAVLKAPGCRLFMTTSSSTFVFMLGFLS
jgi:hypothetical protein